MLTRAPDPLPATHRGHMLSHSSSNTTDSSQISYLCMCVLYVHSVCLCGRERRVCVCVKGMHSFWLVRAEPAASSQRVYSAMFLSLSLRLPYTHTSWHSHTHTHTHTEEHTWGIPGRSVIGLNDLRNNKRPFSFLVRSSFGCIAH